MENVFVLWVSTQLIVNKLSLDGWTSPPSAYNMSYYGGAVLDFDKE
jgi:hypothetical protein